jgi:hypothetical protein
MPAARYWRLIGLEAYAQGELEMSELHLCAGGARIDTGATITCSHVPVSGALSSLSDASTATVVRFDASQVRSPGFKISWDFGTATDVSEIRVGSGSTRGMHLSQCALQYLASGVWETLSVLGSFPWPGPNTLGAVLGQASDPFFSKVTALLHFEGSFDDVMGHVFTPTGGPVIDTSSPLVGGGSYYASSAGRYLTSAASSDWDMGSEDFCIEGKASAPSVGGLMILATNRTATGSDRGPTVFVDSGALRAFCGDASGGIFAACIGGTVLANTTFDWAYNRVGSTFRLFLNGAVVASATSSAVCGGGSAFTVGRDPGTAGREWVGRIDEIRRTRGAGRYTAAYTPLTGPFPDSAAIVGFDPLPVRSLGLRCSVAGSAPVPTHRVLRASGSQLARDVEVGGLGAIYGTTKTKGAPNTPTKARVVLHQQRSKLPVRETWSDPTTGYFEFRGIDVNQQFLTLAEDAAGNFRPVAANKLTPEVLS